MTEFDYPMTLDQAMKHSEEAAKMAKGMGSEKCQEEYERLAGWLRELKELREVKKELDELKESILNSCFKKEINNV